ncbi:hypothetical protein WN943_003783 [Citrus x changshan-huyou]
MSSNSQDFSESEFCEYPLEEDDYQPIISQLFTVNFTPASFFPSSISIGLYSAFTKWSINEDVNHMGKMSLESLRVFYGIPSSVSLERVGENDKPSHPPLGIVTIHPNFVTHDWEFREFSDINLECWVQTHFCTPAISSGNDGARKNKKLEKFPPSKISRKFRDRLIFHVEGSSS